jgi:hypothetical protein
MSAFGGIADISFCDLGVPYSQLRLAIMDCAGIVRRPGAFCHSVVAADGTNAQSVIGEDATPTVSLAIPVTGIVAPFLHGFFVAPK